MVKKAFEDLSRLQPLIPQVVDQTIPTYAEPSDTDESDFDVVFRQNGTDLSVRRDRDLELKRLFDERAVLRVSGHFSDEEEAFVLNVNEHLSVVPLADPLIQGLKTYNEKFGTSIEEPRRPFVCGSFDFSFFIFDLTAQAPATYHLDRDERELVKDHRIYLYRDGVRVLPYGDADDDWLQLDVIRGTQAAGRVLSNDQIVGFVYITQAENPHLRQTNREGLLEAGDVLSDFIALLQIVILYLRRADYARYQAANQQRDEATARRGQAVTAGFEDLLSNDALPKNVISMLKLLQKLPQRPPGSCTCVSNALKISPASGCPSSRPRTTSSPPPTRHWATLGPLTATSTVGTLTMKPWFATRWRSSKGWPSSPPGLMTSKASSFLHGGANASLSLRNL